MPVDGLPISMWWIDPDKKERLKDAIKSGNKIPIEPEVVDYWNNLNKK